MAILKSKSGSSYNTKTGVKTLASGATSKVKSDIDTSMDNVSSSKFVGPDELGGKYGKKWQTRATPGELATVYSGSKQLDQDLAGLNNPKLAKEVKGMVGSIPETAPDQAQVNAPSQEGLVPYEQAAEALKTAPGLKGASSSMIKSAEDALREKYHGGFQQTTASGAQAPATMGQAMGTVQGSLPPPAPDTSFIDTTLNDDSFMTSLMDSITEFMSPTNQRDTLVEEYERLEKQSGLEGIDKELLDARNIIEGTEDDIRNEVTKAGGFATDSQVQAMTLARNKSLIKNYNNLLETRNNIQSRLDTMMNLTKEDKAMAQEKLAQQLDLGFKMQEFKERAQTNAQNQFKWMASQPGGYQALQNMATQSPYYSGLIDKTFGGTGGLATLSTYAQQAQAREIAKQNLELDVMKANIEQSKASAAASYASAAKTRAEATGAKADAKVNKGVETAGIVFSKVNEATKLISGATTGFLGQVSSKIGGTQAFNLASAIDTINANIGFDTLQAMRDASPTGGALGQVSEREISLLQSTVASLKVGQSPEILKKNLQEVSAHYKNWLATVGYEALPNGDIVPVN